MTSWLFASKSVAERRFRAAMGLTLLCMAGAGAYAEDTAVGAIQRAPGKCILTKHDGNLRKVPEHAKNNPYVGGIEAKIVWAELEPEKGKYAWHLIDDFLEECAKYKLQAAFKFWTVSGKVMNDDQLSKGKGRAGADVVYDNTDTPAWLFEDPAVARIGNIVTPKGRLPYYPVFWDKAYQAHLESFIAAFANRYDGHPGIAYIRIGGWQILTNEPSFYGGASEFLTEQFIAQGFNPEHLTLERLKKMRDLPADSLYTKAVVDMMDIWFDHFTKTTLGVTVHPSTNKDSLEYVQMKHAYEHRAMVCNTGLNEGDKSDMRALYRMAHDQYGCKVGWGDLTHVGMHLERAQLDAKGHSLWMEVAKQAAGSDTDPAYQPASKISYVIFSEEALQDTDATRWLAEHLVE